MQTFGMFVKHPQPGQVKTRLAAEIGADAAAGLYAAFVRDLAARFETVAERCVLGYAPATGAAQQYFRQFAPAFDLWPQPDVDLGERMGRFFADHLQSPTDRAVLIGSDSPTLPRALVEQAFQALDTADCVLGPATDGGYYLVGLRGRAWPIFDDITWSAPTVLAQTIARVQSAGTRLALLAPWYDVDTAADLALLGGHIAALQAAGHPACVPTCTSDVLRGIGSGDRPL